MNYLSPAEILYIHSRLTTTLGANHGVRDVKLLKKAINYVHNNEIFPDKYSKTAALLFTIARKKPFIDSNAPTAFMAVQIFLQNNGINFDISNPEVSAFNKIFLPTAKLEEIKNFISQNSLPIKDLQS